MLKVKRLKEARDYSFLMSDAPDELPMKKPSTPLKPGRFPGMVMCNCNLCLAETVQVVLGYLLCWRSVYFAMAILASIALSW
jgi:hypothetical protein